MHRGEENDERDGEMVPKRQLDAALREVEDYNTRLRSMQAECQQQMKALKKHFAVVDLKVSCLCVGKGAPGGGSRVVSAM